MHALFCECRSLRSNFEIKRHTNINGLPRGVFYLLLLKIFTTNYVLGIQLVLIFCEFQSNLEETKLQNKDRKITLLVNHRNIIAAKISSL